MIESKEETQINRRGLIDLEEYEKYLRQLAAEKGIVLTKKEGSLIQNLCGGGKTTAIGESGREYTRRPAREPLKEIQYSCNKNNPLVLVHELTHVEQRLIGKDTSLAQREMQATLQALQYAKNLKYPTTTFNLLFNLINYLPIVGIETLIKKLK